MTFYKINYSPSIYNTTTRTATETERINTAKQQGGVVWSSNRKHFSKPADKRVAAVRKDDEGTIKRDREKMNEMETATFHSRPSTSKASQ